MSERETLCYGISHWQHKNGKCWGKPNDGSLTYVPSEPGKNGSWLCPPCLKKRAESMRLLERYDTLYVRRAKEVAGGGNTECVDREIAENAKRVACIHGAYV